MKGKIISHKTKKMPVMKKFAPQILGNERAKILTDEEMNSMHKCKKEV